MLVIGGLTSQEMFEHQQAHLTFVLHKDPNLSYEGILHAALYCN